MDDDEPSDPVAEAQPISTSASASPAEPSLGPKTTTSLASSRIYMLGNVHCLQRREHLVQFRRQVLEAAKQSDGQLNVFRKLHRSVWSTATLYADADASPVALGDGSAENDASLRLTTDEDGGSIVSDALDEDLDPELCLDDFDEEIQSGEVHVSDE